MRALFVALSALSALFSATACAAPSSPAERLPAGGLALVGGTVVGTGVASVTIQGDNIIAVGTPPDGAERVDLTGHWLVPSVIDAHVHLAYYPAADGLREGGVAGAVDWAAPLGSLRDLPIAVRTAGPMLTAEGGYPTQSWGAGGYGLEIPNVDAAAAAVATVADAGATVVKIVVGAGGPELSDQALTRICDEAHARGMLVGAHALRDGDARRAAAVGADILVHAPIGSLSADVVQAWSTKAVIPTVSAFSGTASTRQLAEAGATVLYGTDFGNTRALGVSRPEIEGLLDAGLDGAAILRAATAAPAEVFGLERLGAIAVGKEASLLVLDADPLVDPLALTQPVAVLHRGELVAGALPGR